MNQEIKICTPFRCGLPSQRQLSISVHPLVKMEGLFDDFVRPVDWCSTMNSHVCSGYRLCPIRLWSKIAGAIPASCRVVIRRRTQSGCNYRDTRQFRECPYHGTAYKARSTSFSTFRTPVPVGHKSEGVLLRLHARQRASPHEFAQLGPSSRSEPGFGATSPSHPLEPSGSGRESAGQ
jgi:hypothetical protein